MPSLEWDEQLELPRFAGPQGDAIEQYRRRGLEALKRPLTLPPALETRLSGESREVWSDALVRFERYRVLAAETLRVATAPMPAGDACERVTSIGALPETWRAQAQVLMQQRRNIYWRLGRLELTARSFSVSLDRMRETFDSDRSRHAEEALLTPLASIQRTLEGFDTETTRPDGDWVKGDLYSRFARHRPVLIMVVHTEEALSDWLTRAEDDERWSYTAASATEPLEAMAAWLDEHDALIKAIAAYSAEVNTFARAVGRPPSTAPAWLHCGTYHLTRLARLSSVLDKAVRMQRELAFGARALRRLRLVSESNESLDAVMVEELAALEHSIRQTQAAVMALEEATVLRWELSSSFLWSRYFPFVLDAESYPSPPNVSERLPWRRKFFGNRDQIGTQRRADPEPEQPRTRRGRRSEPFATAVLDLSRSPARVAEVEQGLLAMSELDAHLASMHRAIEAACGEGGCRGLPTPNVAHSPRNSTWVQQWRELPVPERTLGHNIIVLELSRLHLARQVSRLSRFHGWFSELSSGDRSWVQLPDWQQTWVLYADRQGSYVSFLRAIERMTRDVEESARPREDRPVSPRLQKLLDYQLLLFELTLDYARFVDRGGEAPIPETSLFAAWRDLQDELNQIETATIARDEREIAREKEEAERKAARKAAEEAEKKRQLEEEKQQEQQ